MGSKTICLDAGHYEKYNRSPVNREYYESDMSWKLHNYLKSELETYGFKVITTRSNQVTDLGLEARGRKSKGCDLFLSIHSNACNDKNADYSVACCLIDDKTTNIDEVSVDLGVKLANRINEIMGATKKAAIWRRIGNNNTNYYGVLRGARSVNTPAILLEHGFHTNLKNTNFLLNNNNLKTIAIAEAKIIAEYFDMSKNINTTSSPITNNSTINTSKALSYLVKVISKDGFVNIRKTPKWNNSDIVGQIPTSNIKYTIIEEVMLENTKFGKLKSGIGWISLNENYVTKVN